MSETTAVARVERSGYVDKVVADAKARNAMITQIRGQIWSKDMSEAQMRSISEYCYRNGLDPVRHIEVLGGRIYLNAELYAERAAGFIQAGILIPHEPEFINHDARLSDLADAGDEWAKEEKTRRLRERIKHNVPEKAEAAVVFRITVASTGQTVVGVNWCGKGLRMKKRRDGSTYDDDPVGGSEPTKTAITRAARRAWKQVCEAVPQYGRKFAELESQAAAVNDAIVDDALAAATDAPRLSSGATLGAVIPSPPDGDEYGNGEPLTPSGKATTPAEDNDPYDASDNAEA